MGAPREVYIELALAIEHANSIELRDALLDEWYDITYRATDWDAIAWGFEPRKWMSEERRKMEQRIQEENVSQRSVR